MNLARMISAVFMMIAGASFILASLDKPGRFMWIVLVFVCGTTGHSIGLRLENMIRKHAKGIPLTLADLKIGKTYRRAGISEPQETRSGTWLVWIRPYDDLDDISRICEFHTVPTWNFKVEKDSYGNKEIVAVTISI